MAFVLREQGYDFLQKNRVRVTTVVVVFLLLKNSIVGISPNGITDHVDFFGLLGWFMVVAGVGLRSWAAGIIRKDEALATSGPYTLSRHPLYVGSLLMALGFCLLIGDRLTFFLILGFAIVLYGPTIHNEEVALRQVFGVEWERYTARTAILYPKVWPRDIRAGWSFAMWQRNREYRAMSASLIGLLLLEALHRHFWPG
ncbi:MAG: hypothetical protein A2521_12455 [Deltaproteobacteria bacterium RIFOXYD12_FULL_57_12]|nr:MAG: hypothetical protein A2521_12455 [Deltaproteobacteria bacterium RIFOXYD12_FULL_57_12]